MLFGGRCALREEVGNRAAFPGDKFRATFTNVLADLGILEFQVVLKLVRAHDAHDGDAVFLQDEILARYAVLYFFLPCAATASMAAFTFSGSPR
jgi:hypothetical protein